MKSVLVFFAATGRANAAVLAELESEVRATVSAATIAVVPSADVEADLDRIASVTLPEMPAATASRMMRRWTAMAFDRTLPAGATYEPDDVRARALPGSCDLGPPDDFE